MINILAVIPYCLAIFNLKYFKGNNNFNDNYMSVAQCNDIRAFLAITIVLHHLSLCVSSSIVLTAFSKIPSIIINVFLFFAGYGLYVSSKRKPDYFKTFFKFRFSKILIPLLTSSVIYFVVRVFVIGSSVASIFSNMRNGFWVVSNSWYIFSLIIFYFGFYIIYRFFGDRRVLALFLVFLYTALYIVTFKCVLGYGDYWVNASFGFLFGLMFASYEKEIITFIRKHYLSSLLIIGFTALVLNSSSFILSYVTEIWILRRIIQWLAGGSMCLLIIVITNKVKIGNRITTFIGSISYEIYLIHGLFIALFTQKFVVSNNILLFILVFVLSIASAYALNALDKALCKLIK